MELTRQRREKVSKYIVHSRVGFVKRLVSILINIIMWAYMFIIFGVFISAYTKYNNEGLRVLKSAMNITNETIRELVLMTIIIFMLSLITLFTWKIYNKLRFGKLDRRKMPLPTSDADILELKLVRPDLYYCLKTQKLTILEKNPIKDLYEENYE